MRRVISLQDRWAMVPEWPAHRGDDGVAANGRFGTGLNQVPFTTRDAQSHQRIVSSFAGRTALAVGLLMVLLAALPDRSAEDRWLLVAVGAAASLVGVAMMRRPVAFPFVVLDSMLVLTNVALVLLAVFNHGIEPAIPAIYMMIGYILFAIRPLPVVALHIAMLGVSYACVLAFGPDRFAPVSRWFAVMVLVTTIGAYVRWLVSSARALADAERRDRDLAEAARSEWETQSRNKSVFLSRMSHELRTPLNVVLGFTELLAEQRSGELNERQREYIADVSDSGRHLVTLVDDVLDLADIDSAHVRLAVAPVNLRDVVADSVLMLREQAASNGTALDVVCPSELPGITADRVKLRQVVLNLLANAVRFTPSGGSVTVRIECVGRRQRLSVEDTGIGVHPTEVERIFTEYGQSAGTRGGTGLGLPLARRFVELHGGTLGYRGRDGGGSVFDVDLPPEPPTEDDRTSSDPALAVDDDPDADYSAFTRPASRANRALIARSSLRLWVVGGFLAAILGVITPWPWQGRVGAIGGGLALAAVAIAYSRRLNTLTFRTVEVSTYVMIGGISALTYWVPGFHELVPLGFAWMTMLTFALWPTRRAIAHLALVGATYAVVLAYLDPPTASAYWISIMTMLVFNAVIVGGMSRELRELVRAEQTAHRNARRARQELAATSQHKSMFVANMSHELRTPLNAVIGFAELLSSELVGPLNGRQREYLRDIHAAAQQLLAIINDVLDTAKIEAGQLHLDLDVIPVRALLERVIDIGERSDCDGASVTLHVESGADFVVADRQRMEQVLVQLVTNGVKFTAADGHVDVRAYATDGGELRFAVADSGIGIAADQVHRIFDAFHQGTRLPADHVRAGTGLGLSLAKSIVELHGGRIWVESAPDVGSTFTVALPVSTEAVRQLETLTGGMS